jgi:pentatricopeptide repeat protein
MAVVRRVRIYGLRRGTHPIVNHFYQQRNIELPSHSVTHSGEKQKKNVFFTNSREGDWVCPNCGVLSFSWRNECFKCATSKPSITSIGQPPPRRRNQQGAEKKETSLKDLLVQCQKVRNYDLVIQESEKILKQKKLIKSSVVATMIRAFGKSGQIDRAVELFNEIGSHPFIVRRPTPYHYAAAITACSENGKWETALDVFDHMRVNSRTRSIVVCTSAMSACNRAKQYNHVIRIYNTIKTEGWILDTACYNVVLDSFVKIGNYSRAYEIYEELNSLKIRKDSRTYGVMLECCNRSGDWVLAQELLKQINLSRNVEMNAVMYTSALMAYANGGEPEKGLELFSKLKLHSKILIDYPLYSALLLTLNKLPAGKNSGLQSLETLKEMTQRHIKLSVHVVTTVISCLDKDEMYDSALSLYDMARGNGMFANQDPQISFANTELENLVPTERRIDFRNSSLPLIRVMLRSIFCRVQKANAPPSDDYLIVLGMDRPFPELTLSCP